MSEHKRRGHRRSINRRVGLRLRLCRAWAGLSVDQLAERLDITPRQLRRLENGTSPLGAEQIHRLARILKVPPGVFLPEPPTGGEEDTPDPMDVAAEEVLRRRNALEVAQLIHRMTPQNRDAFVTLLHAVLGRGDGGGEGEE